jgi:hypothetical protein
MRSLVINQALEPSEHPYHPDATQRARREMHHRFWSDWNDVGASAYLTGHVNRYTTVHRDGSSMPWIIRNERLADVADIERRRWAILLEYRRVAAVRWAEFHKIEGDYACFYSIFPSDRDPEGKRPPAFYVYRVDEFDGEKHYVEGTWESTEPKYGRCLVTEEKQPLVAYNLVRLYAKLARRGYWLGMAGEVLDRAIVAKLPEQSKEAYGCSARVEINGRSYWYWWNGYMWKRHNWPEQDTIELVFGEAP